MSGSQRKIDLYVDPCCPSPGSPINGLPRYGGTEPSSWRCT